MRDPLCIELVPYIGVLYVTQDREQFTYLVKTKIQEDATVPETAAGHYIQGGNDDDNNRLTYIVWVDNPSRAGLIAHEASHVVLDVFERIGSDPRQGSGEPFNYMLGYLVNAITDYVLTPPA